MNHRVRFAAVFGLCLCVALAAGAQEPEDAEATIELPPIAAPAETEESAQAATSRTFEKIWYRAEKRPFLLLLKAFKKSGTLTVSATALEFRAGDFQLDVPVATIQGVSVAKMKGDRSITGPSLSTRKPV